MPTHSLMTTAADLATLQLEMIGMRRLPICPWRLARRCGLDVSFDEGRDLVLPNGRVILSTSERDERAIGGKIARAVAIHLLRWYDLRTPAQLVERTARELLVPITALARFAAKRELDYEFVVDSLYNVPAAWVIDALDEIRVRGYELCQLRPPITQLVAKPQARGTSRVPAEYTVMTARMQGWH